MNTDKSIYSKATRTILLAALLITTSLVAYESLNRNTGDEAFADAPRERVIVIEKNGVTAEIEVQIQERMELAKHKMAEAHAKIAEMKSHVEEHGDHVERIEEQEFLQQIELKRHLEHALASVKEQHARDGEVMIRERFSVRSGGELTVKVPGADVEITTDDGDDAEIIIMLSGRDMDAAREYFENLRFEVYASDNDIVVRTQPNRRGNWNWRRKGGAHIQVIAHVPSEFDTDVQTSGGDISVTELDGRVNLNTSGGDISLVRAAGRSATLKTSGGDIDVTEVQTQSIELHTSGGDITAERLQASTIDIKTSGGDIHMEECSGRTEAKTSGGDIRVGRMFGDLSATTSGGRIEVEVEESAGNLDLKTSGGNIVIVAPDGLSADVELRGGSVRMDDQFSFQGEMKKQSARGSINGGGIDISASTSGGSVSLKRR